MKKTISIILAVIMLCPSFVFSAGAVSKSDIAPILYELSIMRGGSDGDLRLDDLVTRAEFTKMAVTASVYKNLVASNIAVSPFKDVVHTHWAAPYIRVAVSNGICKGYPDGSFKPDGNVLFEETVTMLLRLLGYTESDFGAAWPYGQIGIAEKIGLLDDMTADIGVSLSRQDVMQLTYNLLRTDLKNGGGDYILKLGYKIIEDCVLIATANEDSSVGADKVYTSAGFYKINNSFNFEHVGKKGSMIVKNTDELAGFIPNDQIIENHSVYQVLDGEIIVLENGELKKLEADKSLAVYNKSQKTILSAMQTLIAPGDMLTIYKTNNGVIDYGIIKTDELTGPVTVKNLNWLNETGLVNPVVVRNGTKASIADIATNDIIYYSLSLNTVWSYSKTVTGIFERALPNKDMPSSVVVSGITYSLEGVSAVKKLSSNGDFNYGDTITLLLGRTGRVADALDATDKTLYGYMFETGIKSFIDSNGSSYSSCFFRLAVAGGGVADYVTDINYDYLKNSVVKVSFSNGSAKAKKVSGSFANGEFDWKNKKLGEFMLSKDLVILDAFTTDSEKYGGYADVFPQRLDGAQLNSSNIIFSQANDNEEITCLYLNNFTGDAYSYGMMIKSESVLTDTFMLGTYTFDIAGVRTTLVTTDILYSVFTGSPCMISFNAAGKATMMQDLARVDASFTSIGASTITLGNTAYLLSDKVAVYKKISSSGDFALMPINSLIENSDKYYITAYYDKPEKNGGRIRVIVAADK